MTRARRSLLRAGSMLGLLPLVVSGSGCENEIEADQLSATIVSSGRFEVQSGHLVRVTSSAEMECELGVIFGVDYRVDVEGGGSGYLPLEFVWLHPPLEAPSTRVWGVQTPARSPRPLLGWGEGALVGRALWQLEDPMELVDGEYEFVIRRLDDESVLISKTFLLVGC